MTTEILTQKDKELIAVGTAVSAGCQRCCDYHFKRVFEVGASLDEVKMAVIDATDSISHADEMMQRKAYALLDISRPEADITNTAINRISALVKLGAAVASNCTPTIMQAIGAARAIDISQDEMMVTIKLAKMILRKAGQFADKAIEEALGSS
ncbi:MAG: carboxymuconolactone decarboxylase family protein [Amphritea sp.]